MKKIFVLVGVFFVILVFGRKSLTVEAATISKCTYPNSWEMLQKGDLNCDGYVTVSDFAVWKMWFLWFKKNPPTPSAVPSIRISIAPSPTIAQGMCGMKCLMDGSDGGCKTGLTCVFVLGQMGNSGVCRNPKCESDLDCVCSGVTPTVKVSTTPTIAWGMCGSGCSVISGGCKTGLVCVPDLTGLDGRGVCRNPKCETDRDCVCSNILPTATPTLKPTATLRPTVKPTATSTPRPTSVKPTAQVTWVLEPSGFDDGPVPTIPIVE